MFDNMPEWLRLHMIDACNNVDEEIEYLEEIINAAQDMLEARLTMPAPDAVDSAPFQAVSSADSSSKLDGES